MVARRVLILCVALGAAATPLSAAEVARAPAADPAAASTGLRVFAWRPGEVYAVRTAPLRVTTLSLGLGEGVVAVAAGDTVRWKIAETTSGQGAERRAHVLVKPLERGLATNLVVLTTARVYLIDLRSVGPEGFDPAVAWSEPPAARLPALAPPPPPPVRRFAPVGLDFGYRVLPKGRRPAWTPTAALTDGARTYIALPPTVLRAETPTLSALTAAGERRLVNYRQAHGLYVVDQVLERAELTAGARGGERVRIERVKGGRS